MLFYKLFSFNLSFIIPEFYLSFIFFILLLFALYKHNNYQIINNLIIFQLFYLFILQLNTLNITFLLSNGLFIYDNVIKTVKLFIIFSTICYFFFSKNYLKNQKIIFFENSILILIATFGLMLLSMSYHFISLYLTIEIQSLCFYILTMSQRNSILSVEASLKYFILGAIASSFILLGSSFIYGLLGTLSFGQIFLILSNISFLDNINLLNACSLSFLFIFIGLFFKIGAAPFHLWLPDIYEGAPMNITLFFATVPKLTFILLFIRFFFNILSNFSLYFLNIFIIVAFFSISIGAFSAVQQLKIKRLLAYSSISHIGFILLGFSFTNYYCIMFILFYGIFYLIMSLNIWGILVSLFINNKPIKYITDLTGFIKYNKHLSYVLCLNLLSMAGIPPLAGFFIKFFILCGLIQNNYVLTTVIIIILSVISSFYYIRLIKIIFFEKKNNYFFKNISIITSYLIIFFSFSLFSFIIFPNYIFIPLIIMNLTVLL